MDTVALQCGSNFVEEGECVMRKFRLGKPKMFIFVVILVITLIQTVALAEGPYNNYTYNFWGKSIPSAANYLPESVISGSSLNVGEFKNPTDIFFDTKELYLLDSGNSRIVTLDRSLKLVNIIEPVDQNHQKITLQEATGIFVDQSQNIYIADKNAKAVYICDEKGLLISKIEKPKSDILPAGFDYQPYKVLVDSAGMIYVISKGSYSGALQFDQKHRFVGFYGSENVAVTAQLVRDMFWKKIMSKEQASKMARYVPVDYSNFDIDSEDFIYTCRNDVQSKIGQIRKLNPLGQNILWFNEKGFSQMFGDQESYWDFQLGSVESIIIDVDVSDQGFINILDSRRGRIFQYDQNSNLLFAFGGKSNQQGCFKNPVAIESIGEQVVVLDSSTASLTIFHPTPFAQDVHKADILFYDGKYVEALDLWKNVLKYDNNYELANVGIGKAYEKQGKFKEALDYYKQANDRLNYSNAFYQHRSDILHKYFPAFMLGIIVLLILPIILGRYMRKYKKDDYSIDIGKFRYPFYTMLHPFKGFSALKAEKKGSLLAANIIVFLFFIVSIFIRQNTGFPFNYNILENFNIIYTAVSTIGLFVLWVVANWAVSTMMDGEGKFKEIWIFSAYAILPFVLLMIPVTVISNCLTRDEAAFFQMAYFITYAWTAICIIMAVKEVHQYTLKRTILIILLTVVGIALVVVIYSIVYSMFFQLIGFISTIFNEIMLR